MHEATTAGLDDRTQAALARLTANEKACLRRRLLPQTAKEMAIELGVSPHAVEKRLKMARAKLGVSSSLEAARLLARSETGYQRTGPAPSDLAGPAGPPHPPLHGNAPPAGWPRRHASAIWRVTMISSFLAAALAFGLIGAPQNAPAGNTSPEQMRAMLTRTFVDMDRDRSGFVEAAEAPQFKIDGADGWTWMGQYDSDHDGKVSQAEYIANTRGVFQLQQNPPPRRASAG